MKKLHPKIFCGLISLSLLLFIASCNEIVESPTMEYDYVYFTDAVKGVAILDNGNTDTGIPAITNSLGFLDRSLNYSKDTTINLGVFCSGTQMPKGDVKITIEVDESLLDSLSSYGSAVDSKGILMYPNYAYKGYQILPSDMYSINNLDLVIPKGSSMIYLPVLFKTTQINPLIKYILPLRITKVSSVKISPDHDKLLFSPKK
jgi:hypothetical protein